MNRIRGKGQVIWKDMERDMGSWGRGVSLGQSEVSEVRVCGPGMKQDSIN